MVSDMHELYARRHGSLEGLDPLLQADEMAPSQAEGAKPAPSLRVTSLRGEELDLAALRGKVVVLNFWFIGCIPCIVEIPGLNQLVEEFKGKDVVFIAFALDGEKSLRLFLKDKPFNYHIIPESREVAKQYDIRAFPAHVIIDKTGNMTHFLTGGSADRHKKLSTLVARLL